MRLLHIGILVVSIGFASVFAFRYVQVGRTAPFVPQSSSLVLSPPARSVAATLTRSTGVVEQFVREGDGYKEATPGGTIRQGESIATKRGTAEIDLATLGTAIMGVNSEMSFVNLIPDSLTLWHKSGTVAYEVNTTSPFSIRALHTLVVLHGDASIYVSDPIVKIQVTKGTARFALVGEDNTTQTWDITQGQLAQIHDETKRVVLR